ncbi:MAG TPA: DUF2232 domain-containing protein [Gemmatimonadaceae bacterium]|nr:DUF2232 domain-containing protein [Gemmatimonadaceae bacterium]
MSVAPPPPKERGWRLLLLALVCFLFVPAIPPLRAIVPIEQTLVLLTPALAACAWLGWRHGGRVWLALAWSGVAVWVLLYPMAGGEEYAALARGWSLVLAAAFGAIGLFTSTRAFFGRALGAVALTLVACAVVVGVSGSTARRVERVVAAELSDRVESSVSALRARTSPELLQLERERPERARALSRMVDDVESWLRQMAPFGANLFPAMLLFESLAALGLAWSLHHRLSRARLGPSLAAIREFRFDDQLIWGAIAGLVMVLLPRFAVAKGIGVNALVFFGALYALRGVGVMVWFLVAPGRWLGVVTIAMCCVLPIFWSIPVGLGLGDTYWDWRNRPRPPKPTT